MLFRNVRLSENQALRTYTKRLQTDTNPANSRGTRPSALRLAGLAMCSDAAGDKGTQGQCGGSDVGTAVLMLVTPASR